LLQKGQILVVLHLRMLLFGLAVKMLHNVENKSFKYEFERNPTKNISGKDIFEQKTWPTTADFYMEFLDSVFSRLLGNQES
jgi:hypothetical protein